MTATALFFVSLAGIAGLLFLKGWERRRGITLFSTARERADSFVVRITGRISKEVPSALARTWRGLKTHFFYVSGTVLHQTAHFVERRLLKFVNMVKGRGEVQRNGTASAYLKDVFEHKNERRNGNDHKSSSL